MAGMKLMGCGCCFGTASLVSGTFTREATIALIEPQGDGIATSIYGGSPQVNFDVEDITELGAGAVVVGVDAENKRWVCQRTNGEVWTIRPTGTSPELLWGTGSDAAGVTLAMLKWHPTWGYASSSSATQHFSLDGNGDFVNGPYSGVSRYTCVDDAGNIYRATPTIALRNNVNFADMPAAGGFITNRQDIFHDGSELYAGDQNPSVPTQRGIFRLVGIGSPPVMVVDFASIFGSSHDDNDLTFAIWDAKRSQVLIGAELTSGVSDDVRFYRISLDLSVKIWINEGTFAPGAVTVGA